MAARRPDRDRIEDEIFACVTKTEEAIVDAGKKWSEEISGYIPSDPAAVRKLIDDAFDLTESVLKTQRQFAHSVLDSVLKGTPTRRARTVKKATGGPTKKPTASKAKVA